MKAPSGSHSQQQGLSLCRPQGSRPQAGPREALRPSHCLCVSRLGVAAHGESRPCLQQTPEATSCTIPDIQMFSMVPYILNVTAVQPWASSSFVPFVPEHISECGQQRGRGGGRPPTCSCPSPLSPPTSCHPSCPSILVLSAPPLHFSILSPHHDQPPSSLGPAQSPPAWSPVLPWPPTICAPHCGHQRMPLNT